MAAAVVINFETMPNHTKVSERSPAGLDTGQSGLDSTAFEGHVGYICSPIHRRFPRPGS